MPSTRVQFINRRGLKLSGIVEQPAQPSSHFALFAHCFTCTKDLKAIVRISRNLAQQNIGVLRFDFTGLGNSQGEFSDTNFETNCEDILSAVQFLNQEYRPPSLLIGHSLGGAAMIATANQIESAQAICTIASPSETFHLAEFLLKQNPKIETEGQGDVTIGGRTYLMKQQLLNSLRRQPMAEHLANLKLPFLVFHSPTDKTLNYQHAVNMHQKSQGPTSIVTLDQSDHLLIDRADDVQYVADMIARWSGRYLKN